MPTSFSAELEYRYHQERAVSTTASLYLIRHRDLIAGLVGYHARGLGWRRSS
ncbi:MAG: hypothetical protein ACLUEQ_12805 [Cloacibacillus evryensis]